MDLANECVDCACACESEALENVWKILTACKERNFVAVQISPAVRVAIGEKFGMARGEDAVGKIVAALEQLGADVVVDTAVATDALTLLRVKALRENKEAGNALPLYSSECPVWTAHAKENYPEIELLPTATEVCAKLLKKHYGEEMPGKTIRVIALEMGEAKKGTPGVDVVLTLDELACFIGGMEINVRLLKKQPLTAPLGTASGAAYIAAASGGDAEALARALTSDKTQLNFRKFEYSGLYGKQARREATMLLDGETWKFAVVDSIEEADALIADVKAGVATYDYVEVSAGAGGQIALGCDLETEEGEMTRRLRKLGLKYIDLSRAARSADMNAAAAQLLKNWNALCRSDEVDAYDAIAEIVEDVDVIEEVVEEPVEVVVEEAPAAEETVEEVVEETPAAEEAVEEVVEEAPAVEEAVEEVVEESPVAEETVEEVVEEVVEETPVAEEAVEETVEEAPAVEEVAEDAVEEGIEEAPVVEETTEAVEDVFEEEVIEEVLDVFEEEVAVAEVEETVEEIVEEVSEVEEVVEAVEETPAVEEAVEAVEEAPAEEVVTEVVEEVAVAEVEEAVEEIVEETVEEAPEVEEVVESVEEAPVVEEPHVEAVEEAPVVEEVAVAAAQESAEEEEDDEEELPAEANGNRNLSKKDLRRLKRAKKNKNKNKKK